MDTTKKHQHGRVIRCILSDQIRLDSGNGFCRLCSCCTSPEWWLCSCHWSQQVWTMRCPSFGWGDDIHPDFCKACRNLGVSHPLIQSWASAQWWQCCCHRRQWTGTTQHSGSVFRAGMLRCSRSLSPMATKYTQVSAGFAHTVLLRSDGSAVAIRSNGDGQCNIPTLDEGSTYTHIAAGGAHTLLLRSDGRAVAVGRNRDGQCDIPHLDEGMTYTQISAGCDHLDHPVLLRSDGSAVAIGRNRFGHNIPALDKGMTYTQISAGGAHTVLLHSDGSVVALETIVLDNATSHLCLRAWHTPTLLQALFIQCFSGVMGVLLPSEELEVHTATFRCRSQEFATLVTQHVVEI